MSRIVTTVLMLGWLVAGIIFFASPVSAEPAVVTRLTGNTTATQSARTEYAIPHNPFNLALESPGRIWFSAPDADAIGSLMVTSGTNDPVVTYNILYYILTSGSEPYDLVYSGNTVWFTQRGGNKLGRIDTITGVLDEYPMPTPDSAPTGIDIAPNGHVWIVEQGGGKLAEFDPSSETFVEHPFSLNLINSLDSPPQDLAVQNDDTIWFTAPGSDALISYEVGANDFSIVPTGKGSQPTSVVIDESAHPWVSAYQANWVGTYMPGSVPLWKWYQIPSINSSPAGIVVKKQDANWEIWVTENRAGQVARLTIHPGTGTYSWIEYPLLANSQPWGIVADENGSVWIAENARSAILELRPPYAFDTYLSLLSRRQP